MDYDVTKFNALSRTQKNICLVNWLHQNGGTIHNTPAKFKMSRTILRQELAVMARAYQENVLGLSEEKNSDEFCSFVDIANSPMKANIINACKLDIMV